MRCLGQGFVMNTTSISRARLALLPLLGFLAIIPTAAGELQPVEISPSGASGSGPQIASDGAGNVVAIWRELDGDSSWIRAAFRPAGDDWGSSKRISVGAASTESPDLAMDRPGNAVAVWQSSSGHDSVVKAALRPANEQWSAPEDLSAEIGRAHV